MGCGGRLMGITTEMTEYTEQQSLSGVHSIMRVKLAQAGGGARPPPFTTFTINSKVTVGRYNNPVSSLVKICTLRHNNRGEKGRGERNSKSVSALSAVENTITFLVMVTKGTPLVLYPSKLLDKETKILFLVMVYSQPFNNAFEALNLFKNKYVAEIQLHVNVGRLLSIPQSSTQSSGMACQRRFLLHHIHNKCRCS